MSHINLVGGFNHFLFSTIYGIILPIDELHHFSRWLKHIKTTSQDIPSSHGNPMISISRRSCEIPRRSDEPKESRPTRHFRQLAEGHGWRRAAWQPMGPRVPWGFTTVTIIFCFATMSFE